MLNLSRVIKPWKEADALSAHINLYGFWTETTFLTKSGDLGMVLSVTGVDYESLDNDEQQYAVKRLESALKSFGEGFHVYLRRGFGESLARYFDMAFNSGKHCALPGERRSCLETQNKTCAALRASVLCQKEDARSAPLGSSAVAEPRRQRYARDVLRRNASQIQHDCAESTRLQK